PLRHARKDEGAQALLEGEDRRGEGAPGDDQGRGSLSPKRPTRVDPLPSDLVSFAHASERQFARLLDFYQIEWEYEPRSFDLEQDGDGNVIQRFTPDFYLPAYDLFIEITTLNQKLVTK